MTQRMYIAEQVVGVSRGTQFHGVEQNILKCTTGPQSFKWTDDRYSAIAVLVLMAGLLCQPQDNRSPNNTELCGCDNHKTGGQMIILWFV